MSDSEEQQNLLEQPFDQPSGGDGTKKLDDDFEALESAFGTGDQAPASASPPAQPEQQPVQQEEQKQPQETSDSDPNKMLLCCSYLERADPRLKSLLLWSDPKRSGAVLFSSLTLLWACMSLSFVSVLAYLGLAALLCTCAVRLYAFTVKRGVAGTGSGGEQQQQQQQQDLLACLSEPIRLPRDCVINFVDSRLACMERDVNVLLDLLLFRDSVRTLKFFCCLIVLTYVGSWFNALTLVSFALVSSFCLPKAYSVYYKKVDAVLVQLLDRYRQVNATIRASIPFGKEKKN
ncbi:hypothetical protein BOX15_Mlig020430g2 [Macrostomum lignano]|uniref:Reticulon-like protein n=1 Tax=Macrostomum lignano TaxID=282301 RepID=A0A267EPG0_9PLAT|nr:hypothetical protein BOX15_Mlig020430g2 [Macrostomum lignano]